MRHTFYKYHNFFTIFAMDKHEFLHTLSKASSLNETQPGTPSHKPSNVHTPVSSEEKAELILEWLEKKNIKVMANPEDLQTNELNRKKHGIS